jgi:hypothetical protein
MVPRYAKLRQIEEPWNLPRICADERGWEFLPLMNTDHTDRKKLYDDFFVMSLASQLLDVRSHKLFAR